MGLIRQIYRVIASKVFGKLPQMSEQGNKNSPLWGWGKHGWGKTKNTSGMFYGALIASALPHREQPQTLYEAD
jgi:hypothetical protein